jgi:cobalt/nickel transport system ATP-binding protein
VSELYQLAKASFAYPGRPPALLDITLNVLLGEHLALIGANGSGKSTLLHLLAGLQFATQGRVEFEGREMQHDLLNNDADFRRMFRSRVGMLFQNSDTQLFCNTVREEVAFGPLQLNPRDRAIASVDEMLDAFEITHLADEPPYALSGGEKRRVALATVLVMNPDVLLLDEPTSNLDPKTCDFLFEQLDRYLSDPNKTVVTATHDLKVAAALARNCAVLTPDHRVESHAPVGEILSNRELLIEVNLLGGRSRIDGG